MYLLEEEKFPSMGDSVSPNLSVPLGFSLFSHYVLFLFPPLSPPKCLSCPVPQQSQPG